MKGGLKAAHEMVIASTIDLKRTRLIPAAIAAVLLVTGAAICLEGRADVQCKRGVIDTIGVSEIRFGRLFGAIALIAAFTECLLICLYLIIGLKRLVVLSRESEGLDGKRKVTTLVWWSVELIVQTSIIASLGSAAFFLVVGMHEAQADEGGLTIRGEPCHLKLGPFVAAMVVSVACAGVAVLYLMWGSYKQLRRLKLTGDMCGCGGGGGGDDASTAASKKKKLVDPEAQRYAGNFDGGDEADVLLLARTDPMTHPMLGGNPL